MNFYYDFTKGFDYGTSRQGPNTTTTYYKLSKSEKDQLFGFINAIHDIVLDESKTDIRVANWLNDSTGLTKMKNGSKYTPMVIIQDLINQMAKGHDPCESMINRWNKVFNKLDSDLNIIMKKGLRPTPLSENFDQMFD